ncbi:hypothetical protein [Haloglomus litoreum]|uniref:hypothetical protein n=1 Tax=Haloglomus litoreum TaxID=3034026 RepID=UPI0023E8A523|nr:hypothetical protein [Haloglomus sp. DT116]
MAPEQADEADGERETRWVVQWAEPFGDREPKRIVETEAEAEAVIEAMKAVYPPSEEQEGAYRVELGADVFFTKVEVPFGPLPDDEWDEQRDA